MENTLNKFCSEYNLPLDVLEEYLDSLLINDVPCMDTYKLILEDCCPYEKLEIMRHDLKDIQNYHILESILS